MPTNPATTGGSGSPPLATPHSAGSSKGTTLPAPPNQNDLVAARKALEKAQQAETAKLAKVTGCQQALEDAQQNLDQAQAELNLAQEPLPAAQQDVDKQLTTMADASLDIDGPAVTVFQGGEATFTARSKYQLDPKLVTIYWETSGCPIVKGQGTPTVTVDTSSVGAGDYDIRVSLVLSTQSAP